MFDDVVGQETAKRILGSQIGNSRIPQVYLFHGPFGVGKRQMAISLAKALNCERGGGCGKCSSCAKIERCVHPDVQIVFPIPQSGKADELAEWFERARASNFKLSFTRKTSISIDTVRALSSTTSIRPLEATFRVVVIIDADRMTVEASNAFLKVLEEPSPHSIFILVTERPHHLPKTVWSRCQPIRFRSLSVREITDALVKKGMERDRVDLASRLAGGSLGRALFYSSPERLKIRARLVQGFLALAEKRLPVLVAFSQWLVDECDKQVFVETFISLYRDLLLLKEGMEGLVQNFDSVARLRARATSCRSAAILQSIDRLEDFAESFERSVNLKVAFPPLLFALA